MWLLHWSTICTNLGFDGETFERDICQFEFCVRGKEHNDNYPNQKLWLKRFVDR